MAPVFLYERCSDHQGKSAGPYNDHYRNAHKEIFHFFIAPHTHRYAIMNKTGLSIER